MRDNRCIPVKSNMTLSQLVTTTNDIPNELIFVKRRKRKAKFYKPSYIDIEYNVTKTGSTKILGNRSELRSFDLTQLFSIVIDNETIITPSYTYNFTTTGAHKARLFFKPQAPSLYCLLTNRGYIETSLDLTHFNPQGLTNLQFLCEAVNSDFNLIADMTNWDVSNVTTMNAMFQGNYGLKNIGDLSNWNTSNVTDMAYMFNECSGLTSLGDLSNWNTSACTNMSYMFNKCSGLTSLGDLSNWDVSKVTTMKVMFQNCIGLTSLGDLSNWNTSACTNMSYMFYGCNSLTSLNLSGWNTSNVTTMKSMFSSCSGLTSLNLSGWNTSNVTDMENMFAELKPLQYLNLDGWDFGKVTNMQYMFNHMENVSNLKGILENMNPSACTKFAYMVNQCFKENSNNSGITSLDLRNWDMRNAVDINLLLYCNRSLKSVDVRGWRLLNCKGESVAFWGCYNLETIRLDKGWFENDNEFYKFDYTNWSRDSMMESLYTNQEGRDYTKHKYVVVDEEELAKLSQEDLDLIESRGFTVISVATMNEIKAQRANNG